MERRYGDRENLKQFKKLKKEDQRIKNEAKEFLAQTIACKNHIQITTERQRVDENRRVIREGKAFLNNYAPHAPIFRQKIFQTGKPFDKVHLRSP
jgi:hypothetical protein